MPSILAIGTFVLAPNATQTVVQVPPCTPSSVILRSPQSPDAANDVERG
jgi:hypothetical protein